MLELFHTQVLQRDRWIVNTSGWNMGMLSPVGKQSSARQSPDAQWAVMPSVKIDPGRRLYALKICKRWLRQGV